MVLMVGPCTSSSASSISCYGGFHNAAAVSQWSFSKNNVNCFHLLSYERPYSKLQQQRQQQRRGQLRSVLGSEGGGGGDGVSSSKIILPAAALADSHDIIDQIDNDSPSHTYLSSLQTSSSTTADKNNDQTNTNKVTSTHQPFIKTLWEFSRPHTLIGSAVAVPTISFFAAPPGANLLSWSFINPILFAVLPALLINIYITGLNQITDIEIDKVNKPNLPIVAGKLSKGAAIWTVLTCLVGGIGIGFLPTRLTSLPLQVTLIASAVIGTLYSLRPFRLKRFPLFAAICILSVRGSVINTGFYAHIRQASFGIMDSATLSSLVLLPFRDLKCGLMTAYFALFGIVIALMKDVPDVEGDEIFQIPSFSVVHGQESVFRFSRRMMTAILWGTAGFMLAAARDAWSASLSAMAGGRVVLAGAALVAGHMLRARGGLVKTDDQKEVAKYYMFLWKVFYCSYLFLPLAR